METKSCPENRSFENDVMLKRPPPDFILGPEHWLGFHEEIQKRLWQAYRLVNPTTSAEAEQSLKVVEVISRAREELAETKAREVLKEEYQRKRSDPQIQLEETARQLWTQDRVLRNAEERIAGAKALIKELKAEVVATSASQLETYDQYHKVLSGVENGRSKVGARVQGSVSSRLVAVIAQAARSSPVGSVPERRLEAGWAPANGTTTADKRGGTEYGGVSLDGLYV